MFEYTIQIPNISKKYIYIEKEFNTISIPAATQKKRNWQEKAGISNNGRSVAPLTTLRLKLQRLMGGRNVNRLQCV